MPTIVVAAHDARRAQELIYQWRRQQPDAPSMVSLPPEGTLPDGRKSLHGVPNEAVIYLRAQGIRLEVTN
jgi:hypothetical protein